MTIMYDPHVEWSHEPLETVDQRRAGNLAFIRQQLRKALTDYYTDVDAADAAFDPKQPGALNEYLHRRSLAGAGVVGVLTWLSKRSEGYWTGEAAT